MADASEIKDVLYDALEIIFGWGPKITERSKVEYGPLKLNIAPKRLNWAGCILLLLLAAALPDDQSLSNEVILGNLMNNVLWKASICGCPSANDSHDIVVLLRFGSSRPVLVTTLTSFLVKFADARVHIPAGKSTRHESTYLPMLYLHFGFNIAAMCLRGAIAPTVLALR
ncbi:uncharacterized protein BJ212DRAFT_1584937 [Suillus subaureus]|uniref:Uncharacterized protein n=1 Tax=Suillus subaureus TaxID=48587 RepID=A0A9P7JHN6_9AGAM|nr:uncharacterized protein BJ212DRAFT_1584937 [Suillus subaureus]KAG1823363.1 hypothetical protein BJ212DRAFT_1584937 [Suillus subaureus]